MLDGIYTVALALAILTPVSCSCPCLFAIQVLYIQRNAPPNPWYNLPSSNAEFVSKHEAWPIVCLQT